MPCVSPDGKPTESGAKMLAALRAGKSSPEAIAAATDMPLFRVRSGVRELVSAGYVSESGGAFSLTDQGVAAL